MTNNVTYWRKGDTSQNLGDFLSEMFLRRIAAGRMAPYARIRLIGSVLSDFIIHADLGADSTNPQAVVGYWGCGLRDQYGLQPASQARCRFHGVRGPLTRDCLKLPEDTPIGDPALLLPLFHSPQPVIAMSGRRICVPHFHDTTPDRNLLEKTGADGIIRSRLAPSLTALAATIDAICAADFILAGALHAAIIACAYGRPFAFYDNARIDLPFKWLDFAASIDVPVLFARTMSEALNGWATLIAPALRRPCLAPILEAFPGEVRPGLLDAARAWDNTTCKKIVA